MTFKRTPPRRTPVRQRERKARTTGRFVIRDGIIIRKSLTSNPNWTRKSFPYRTAAVRAEVQEHPKVLIVDDESLVHRSASRLAKRAGFREEDVFCADGGKEALELIESEGPFKLVILDLVMSGMGGNEVVQALVEGGRGDIVSDCIVINSGTLSIDLKDQTARRIHGRILEKGDNEGMKELFQFAVQQENQIRNWAPAQPYAQHSQ